MTEHLFRCWIPFRYLAFVVNSHDCIQRGLENSSLAGLPLHDTSALGLFRANPFQGTAALVGQGLQEVEVFFLVSSWRITLDGKKPDNPVSRPDGDVHQ